MPKVRLSAAARSLSMMGLCMTAEAPSFSAAPRTSVVPVPIAAGHDDDLHARIELAHRHQHVQPFHFRHDDVGDREVERAGLQQFQPDAPIFSFGDIMAAALQHLAHNLPHHLFVVDQKNPHPVRLSQGADRS
jgi:hypothetical protein